MAHHPRVAASLTLPTVADFFVSAETGSPELFSLIVVRCGQENFAAVFTLAHGLVLGDTLALTDLPAPLVTGLGNAETVARATGSTSATDIRHFDGKLCKYRWVR